MSDTLMPLIKSVQKFRTHFHSLKDVFLFVRIFFLITILPVLIKVLTIPQLMQTLTPRAKRFNKVCKQDIEKRIVHYTDYILGRNFWVYKSTCLKRSLTLYHFFRRLGIDVQICFGVRRKKDSPDLTGNQDIEGHAWLLNNGEFFREMNTESAQAYKMTYCFPEMN
jgi:hypothetical protein